MSRPNDEGAGDCGAHPPKTYQNQSLHFANDGGDSKALATMMADGAFLVGRWNYSRAVPCLRAVGDLLRQIGGR